MADSLTMRSASSNGEVRKATIDFDSIDNFRDFGGYATGWGRALRRRILYRSGDHSRASEADLAILAGLGIGHIIDLRRPIEREFAPSRRWRGFAARVLDSDLPDEDHREWTVDLRKLEQVDASWFERDRIAFYSKGALSHRHISLFREYFRALADSKDAVLVHCAAGKDRTGIISALTLHVMRVHPDDVVQDFMITNNPVRIDQRIARLGSWLEQQTGHRLDAAVLRIALSVQPAYLHACFTGIEAACGSVDHYLANVLGVDQTMRSKLAMRLLE